MKKSPNYSSSTRIDIRKYKQISFWIRVRQANVLFQLNDHSDRAGIAFSGVEIGNQAPVQAGKDTGGERFLRVILFRQWLVLVC